MALDGKKLTGICRITPLLWFLFMVCLVLFLCMYFVVFCVVVFLWFGCFVSLFDLVMHVTVHRTM